MSRSAASHPEKGYGGQGQWGMRSIYRTWFIGVIKIEKTEYLTSSMFRLFGSGETKSSLARVCQSSAGFPIEGGLILDPSNSSGKSSKYML